MSPRPQAYPAVEVPGPAGGPPSLSGVPVSPRRLALLLSVGGVIGFVAAFTLTVERFRLAANPAYRPSCSINPILSCGSVMATRQAAVFGFPNPLMGIAAFAVTTTLGVLLLAGVVLPRFVRLGLLAAVVVGCVFVAWLISQSLFSIHALCPYCMVVWAVVIPTTWTLLADALDRGDLPVPRGARAAVAVFVAYRSLAVVASAALVVVLIGIAFWGDWQLLAS